MSESVRIECLECGYEKEVTEGKWSLSLTPMESAKARRAGHIGGNGCAPDSVHIYKDD